MGLLSREKGCKREDKRSNFKVLQEKNQLRILYPGKIPFKNKENLRLLRHIKI